MTQNAEWNGRLETNPITAPWMLEAKATAGKTLLSNNEANNIRLTPIQLTLLLGGAWVGWVPRLQM